MKKASLFASIYFTALVFQGCSEAAPKATGLPGDNLDLYAVLALFKSSSSVEDFEKSLNDKSKSVNNLDLNGDGKVDYIRVVDKYDGDDHAITLRVPISKDESQDMAVIEIEKTGDKTASIQVIGDEAMYGKDVIIEPNDKTSTAGFIYASSNIGVNVWLWPSVTYIYEPAYVVWESPYYYDYYPTYWVDWAPIEYEIYAPMEFQNHGQYVSYEKRRFKHAHEMYYSDRQYSGFVSERQKNGDFHEGKQMPYKGNKAPMENSGNVKHDDGNASNGKDNYNKPGENNMGNDKNGNNEKVNASKSPASNNGEQKKSGEQKPTGGNQKQGGGDQKPAGGNQKQGGDQKPAGGNQKQGGGDQKPKGGGKPK